MNRMITAVRKPTLILSLALPVLMVACSGDAPPRQQASAATSAEPVPAGNLELGGTLPDFELPTLDGEMVRLHDLIDGDHYVAVIWHAPTCPCAQNCAEAITLEMSGEEYADVRFVGIVSDRLVDLDWYQDDLRAEKEQGRVPFPVLIDRDQEVLSIYGAPRTPTVWLTDKVGRIRFYGAPENTLEPSESSYRFLLKEAVDALKAGREPEVTNFPPIGCLIGYDEA